MRTFKKIQVVLTAVSLIVALLACTATVVVTITPTPPSIDFCDCSENIYDCTDFDTPTEAQECYDHCMQLTGYDVHELDVSGNDQACHWDRNIHPDFDDCTDANGCTIDIR